jgi:hypothetical protein
VGLNLGKKYKPMATTLHEGRVKFPANKVWQSKQQGGKDYVSLKVDLDGGGEAVVYANVGSPDQSLLASYAASDHVKLSYDGKKYSVVGTASTLTTANNTTLPAAKEPAPAKQIDNEQAKAYALTYAAVFNLLSEKLPVTTPADVVGSAASTVFIALTRN